MADAYRKENSHYGVQDGAVSPIELSNGYKDEGVRNVLEEIHVAAAFQEERVRALMVAAVVLLAADLAANPLLVLDALVHDAVAEQEEVGGER